VRDLRLAPNPVDREHDAMQDAVRLDNSLPALAVKSERHGEDRLQGVTLLAAARRHVGLARRHPHCVVEDTLDRFGR